MLLRPFSLPYAMAVRLRNAWYDRGTGVHRARLPVISVGNLTTGGTGKTPLVMNLVQRLRMMGCRPAIVMRGYAAAPGSASDEALEYRRALPGTPVVVDPDRVAGAATAYTVFDADGVVLDDGFQHRRLARDLDIVAVDALNPWGGRQLLPAGRLREPLRALGRADIVVISRSNQATAETLRAIEQEVRAHAPRAALLYAAIEIERLARGGGEAADAEELAYRAVLPVAGIGNPASFLRLIEARAGRVCAPQWFADHFRYTRDDAAGLVAAARNEGADWVVVTRKDWVKLAPLWPAGSARDAAELVCVETRMSILDPDGVLDGALARVVGVARGPRLRLASAEDVDADEACSGP